MIITFYLVTNKNKGYDKGLYVSKDIAIKFMNSLNKDYSFDKWSIQTIYINDNNTDLFDKMDDLRKLQLIFNKKENKDG